MQASAQPLVELTQRVSNYLPTLLAGAVVLVLGLAVGWVAKTAVVRILIWLRLDRLGGRVGWRAAFGKGDVRAALYELLGSAAMAVIVLIFLDNALAIWGLTVLSRMIDNLVFYVPNLALVGLIVLFGTLLAGAAASGVEDALTEEELPHPRLVARIVKVLVLCLVVALALWQLNLARQIVLAGFLIAFGSLGIAFALGVGLGTARAVQRGWESLFGRKEKG